MDEKPPTRLKAKGRKLWTAVTHAYELRVDELTVLEDACRTADLIDEMTAELRTRHLIVPGSMGQDTINPLIPELRMYRAALASLLGRLKLPDESGLLRNQQREAAQTRWARAHGSIA